ncbi:PadR family transcriptional regulator [Kocuria sp.]|uniref:PadR family transcriptional regulator n=1 Tax=Kocuria sp. TaxID=1871328 RepID=UPI0026E0F413|nr:PadR family transcriptional regulator [Kocuria sp.]MDO5617774.1 PadR family transcriptional regulator [Kocuria sp.]
MSLRAALLALISAGPMTGYDVGKRFAGSVGNVWYASDSQIYPELRKMERDGLLATEQVAWGTLGTTKTQYQVTDAGRQELATWVGSPLSYPLERDPVRLRTAYLEWTDDDAASGHFRDHIQHHQAVAQRARDQITALQERTHPTLRRRLKGYSEQEAKRVIEFKLMAYRGVVARAEAEIEWAQQCLSTLQSL